MYECAGEWHVTVRNSFSTAPFPFNYIFLFLGKCSTLGQGWDTLYVNKNISNNNNKWNKLGITYLTNCWHLLTLHWHRLTCGHSKCSGFTHTHTQTDRKLVSYKCGKVKSQTVVVVVCRSTAKVSAKSQKSERKSNKSNNCGTAAPKVVAVCC